MLDCNFSKGGMIKPRAKRGDICYVNIAFSALLCSAHFPHRCLKDSAGFSRGGVAPRKVFRRCKTCLQCLCFLADPRHVHTHKYSPSNSERSASLEDVLLTSFSSESV